MSSKVPIVREVAWVSVLPQLAVMVLLIVIWYQFNQSEHILYGALTYLGLSQLLRRTIAKEHQKGIRYIKLGHFDEAIPHFENSYEFFDRNAWIDKYRYLTMLSSGKASYREMALVNLAFCHGQSGKGELAREYYEKTLNQFPESTMAKAGIRFLNSVSQTEREV